MTFSIDIMCANCVFDIMKYSKNLSSSPFVHKCVGSQRSIPFICGMSHAIRHIIDIYSAFFAIVLQNYQTKQQTILYVQIKVANGLPMHRGKIHFPFNVLCLIYQQYVCVCGVRACLCACMRVCELLLFLFNKFNSKK